MERNDWQLKQAQGLLKLKKVKPARINPSSGIFIFIILDEGQEITVTKNHKGWMCDAIQDEHWYQRKAYLANKRGEEPPMRWSCSMMPPGRKCYHIIACELFLEKLGISSVKDSSPGQNAPGFQVESSQDHSRGGTNEEKTRTQKGMGGEL